MYTSGSNAQPPLRSQAISYFPEPSPIADYAVQLGVTGFYFLEGLMVKVKLDRSSWFCIRQVLGSNISPEMGLRILAVLPSRYG